MLCPHCGRALSAGAVCDCRLQEDNPGEGRLPSQSYGGQQYRRQQAPRDLGPYTADRRKRQEPAPPRPKNAPAVLGLVVALAAIVLDISLLGIPSVLAIVLSAVGMWRAKQNRDAGYGLALAGLIIGVAVLVCTIIVYATCASFTTGSASLLSCSGSSFEYRNVV